MGYPRFRSEHVRLCLGTDSNGHTLLMTTNGDVVENVTNIDVRIEPGVTRAIIEIVDFVVNAAPVMPEDIDAAVEGLKVIEDDLAGR